MDQHLAAVMDRLRDEYGVPEPQDRPDPILSLIQVLLSHNTTDDNRDRAYTALMDRYDRDPRAIMDADRAELADTISVAGLHNVKAERIQETLRTIEEKRGELSLDFLHDESLDDAKAWLQELPGVGPKSAAVVLNFTFSKAAFPVDTHVYRLSKRLGLIPDDATRDSAHDILESATPDDRIYEFHINLIRHGRAVCKAPTPHCSDCTLTDICPWYAEHRDDPDAYK